LLAEVEVLGAPIPPVATDPLDGSYSVDVAEGSYALKVSSYGHESQTRDIVVDQNLVEDFVLEPLPCILLVDDDNDSPDVRPLFTGALDNLGYDYNVFDVGGGSTDGPSLAELEGYSMVIWFSGDKYGGSAGPNATDEANLAAYLDGGGRLFLSSQDYLWDFGLTPFGSTYLGIGSFTSDTGDATTKYGVPGDPIGDGLGPYSLSYPSGFTDYGDIVNAGAGASVAFRAGASGGNNLDVDKDGGDWKTVFFGTSWVPIYNANAANGEQVLQRIIDWFGGCGGQPLPKMFVGNIKTKYRIVDPGPPTIYKVLGRVPVFDEAMSPVVGAAVTAQWELPGGQIKVKTATTRPNGSAYFQRASPQEGLYILTVLDVLMAGLEYDPSMNFETSEDLMVP